MTILSLSLSPSISAERTECDRLKSPKNGFVVVTTRTIGSHVKYNCFEGFYLSEPRFRECLPSGWSGKAPECLGRKKY